MGIEIIFIKYLLIPILAGLAMIGFAMYAKTNALLRQKRLMLFVLIQAVILIIPSLFGLMTYEFVPYGMIGVQVSFFLLGIMTGRILRTDLFASIGMGDKTLVIFLCLFTSAILGGWGFFLLFEYFSNLGYSLWVSLTVIWFFLPLFFQWGKDAYIIIPPPYYQVLDPLESGPFDNAVWEDADYLRMMNISFRIKHSSSDKEFSAYPVRVPSQVSISQWFIRYIKDQRIKFPNAPIEMEENGEPYCWIFYTTKFFIFNRPISPDKTFEEYKVRNKAIMYARRVDKVVLEK